MGRRIRGVPMQTDSFSLTRLALLEPFQLPFVQRGLIEVLILAVPAGLLGTWIVLRGLAFFSHAVGTAAFPGLVLADGLGFAAPLGAFGAAIAFTPATPPARAAGATGARQRRSRSSWSAAWPRGVILASDVFGSGANVETLLFGSLLLVDGGDIVLAAAAAASPLLATALVGQRWLGQRLRPRRAARGARRRRGLLDAAPARPDRARGAAALSVVGALLVTALFVVPAVTARLLDATGCGAWQLASVALVAVEGAVGLWLSVKTDAPPGRDDRLRLGRRLRRRRRRRALARGPRRRRAVAARGRRRARCSSPAAALGSGGSGRPRRRRDDDARSATGSARSAAARSRSTRSCSRTPTPTSTSRGPATSRRAAGAELVFANGDDLDAWIDEIVSDSGSDADRRRPRRRASRTACPARRAAPRRPGMTRTGGTTRATPRPRCARSSAASPPPTPPTGAVFARNAARLPAPGCAPSTPASPRCIAAIPPARRKLVTDHDAFGYFAEALRDRRRRRRHPVADDPGPALGRGPRRPRRDDRARARRRRSSRRARSAPRWRRRSPAQTGASADYTLYGDTLGPAGSAGATYLGMERPTPTRWSRGFTGGEARDGRRRAADRGRAASRPATAAPPAIDGRRLRAAPGRAPRPARAQRRRQDDPAARPARRAAAAARRRCGWRPAAPRSPRPSARGSTTRSRRSTWRRWARSRACPGGAAPAAASAQAAARGAEPGRPRRARRARPSASSPAASASAS